VKSFFQSSPFPSSLVSKMLSAAILSFSLDKQQNSLLLKLLWGKILFSFPLFLFDDCMTKEKTIVEKAIKIHTGISRWFIGSNKIEKKYNKTQTIQH
jgi:hypothetical protein